MTTKEKKENESKVETLELLYNLFDLPSAQHKAGLAGLVMMIESMKLREMGPVPEVSCSPSSVRLTISREILQAIFDDLYNATLEEIESKQKWAEKEPKNIIEIEIETEKGKPKKEKRFIYDAVVPAGHFLNTLYPPNSGPWLKLWRDMLWNTLRSRPLARGVYEERAQGLQSSFAVKMWNSLIKAEEKKRKGQVATDSIVGSIFIGAQDVNEERVSFQGEPKLNLLLHFWTIPSLIFLPRASTIDHRIDGSMEFKNTETGYLLAIPEPTNMVEFVKETRELLSSLETSTTSYKNRPQKALIDLPEEGGMEYMWSLDLVARNIGNKGISDFLSFVELYHLEKQGNNVRAHSQKKISSNSKLLREYEGIRDNSRNPIYKNQLIKNLLKNEPWFSGMQASFNNYPWEIFIMKHGSTPKFTRFFGEDVRNKFKAIDINLELFTKGDLQMSNEVKEKLQDDLLAKSIYQMIRSYAWRRAEEKSGRKYEDFKNSKDQNGKIQYPKEYNEAVQKVCSDAFLAMRSRREQDFVEYFTGTICSVPQLLPEEQYLLVTKALLLDSEKVKTLSMLALSSCSYT